MVVLSDVGLSKTLLMNNGVNKAFQLKRYLVPSMFSKVSVIALRGS